MKAEGYDISSAFWRNEDGSWICIDPVTIDHPKGRIPLAPGTFLLPGETHVGVDVAAWLEAQERRRRAAAD